ncbi:MAG: hypothetical protein WC197_08495 [Candidatus Gastranaerophilaceae bacterium]|jgi:hypothetical protein
MNKQFKVIQLNGFSGLFLIIFIFVGIFFGFILFPVKVLMFGWNSVVNEMLKWPSINYFQAALLWGFIVLSFYTVIKKSISIKIQQGDELTDIEIKKIVSDVTQNPEMDENED